MGQRHPDLVPPVLEAVDEADLRHGPAAQRSAGIQASITVSARRGLSEPKDEPWSSVNTTTSHRPAPGPDRNGSSSCTATSSRRRRRQRREPVLEHHDVIAVLRDLGQPAVPGRAQRAVRGRRPEGALLAMPGDHRPLPGEHVPAGLGQVDRRGQLAQVRLVVPAHRARRRSTATPARPTAGSGSAAGRRRPGRSPISRPPGCKVSAKLTGPARNWCSGSTPGPQDAVPNPFCARSRLRYTAVPGPQVGGVPGRVQVVAGPPPGGEARWSARR